MLSGLLQMRWVWEQIAAYARETSQIHQPLVRQRLAEMAIEIEIGQLMAYNVACMLDRKNDPGYEASVIKVFTCELRPRIANLAENILGLYGQLQEGSKWAPLNGFIEKWGRNAPRRTVTGGASEIQRDIIARRAVGLPRSR